MEFGGVDFRGASDAGRRHVGFVGHNTFLYDELTVRENLRFYALLYGLPDAEHAIAARLEEMELAARESDLLRNLSRGLRQRAAIARALLHAPSLLLLDEPFTGLDPRASATLENLLRGFHESGRTILASTHNLEQIVNLATRIVVLDRGTLVYDAPNQAERVAEIRALFVNR
jgi:heme exporter protein A